MRLEIEIGGQEFTALYRYTTNLKQAVTLLQNENISKLWKAVFVTSTVSYLHTKQVWCTERAETKVTRSK
jgi:hypothetical protein